MPEQKTEFNEIPLSETQSKKERNSKAEVEAVKAGKVVEAGESDLELLRNFEETNILVGETPRQSIARSFTFTGNENRSWKAFFKILVRFLGPGFMVCMVVLFH